MPEIRFEAKPETVAVLDGYCSATGRCRTAFINALLEEWAQKKLHEASVVLRAGGKPAGPDRKALARTADDVALELHGLGNALHKAGLHQHGTAADVAAGMIETIVEELRDGC